MTLTKKQFDEILQSVKDTEREKLAEMPPLVSLKLQSGYLLGYADCLVKIHTLVRDKLPDSP